MAGDSVPASFLRSILKVRQVCVGVHVLLLDFCGMRSNVVASME